MLVNFSLMFIIDNRWGCVGFDGSSEVEVACRVARHPVKKAECTISADESSYAMAA